MDTEALTDIVKKMSTGQQVAAGSGVVALLAIFMPWYGLRSDFFDSVTIRGTEFTFAWLGMLLLVGAAVLVVLPLFGKRVGNDQVHGEQLALVAAAVGALFWLIRLASVPGTTVVSVFGRSWGLYVAILAAAGVIAGIVMTMKEQDIALPTVDDIKSLQNGVTATDEDTTGDVTTF